VSAPPTTRRERLRSETTREIKAIALEQMAADGPSAISLRAIARQMGMTAGAIYGYFKTRDVLISALIADVYGAVADAQEAARDAVPADDPAGRLLAVAHAYRDWAIGHPEEFRLIYGDAVAGYEPPEGGAATDAEHRACAVLTGLVAAAWPRAEPRQRGGKFAWSDFDEGFIAVIREQFPDLPPAAVALALRIWGRMHGLVALEVYGHLHPQVRDAAKLYRAEMLDLTRALGLEPRSPRRRGRSG
jgi:AcrR family transcriptional regulator